jgi:hypothetical protein
MPDDGPVRTETCSLPFIKYDVPDVNYFIIVVIKCISWAYYLTVGQISDWASLKHGEAHLNVGDNKSPPPYSLRFHGGATDGCVAA